MLRPVRVVAFVLASRLASQDLSGEGKTGTERDVTAHIYSDGKLSRRYRAVMTTGVAVNI